MYFQVHATNNINASHVQYCRRLLTLSNAYSLNEQDN